MVRTDNPVGGTFETEYGAGSEPAVVPCTATPGATIHVRMRKTAPLKWAGRPMLLPPAAPQFLAYADLFTKQLVLFDLADTSPTAGTAGIVVAEFEQMPSAAAVSADGGSLCIGDYGGGLQVFDSAAVLAAAAAVAGGAEPAPAVEPRAQSTQPLGGMVGMIAFSQDGDRLFAICQYGPITVHDARREELPILRTLPFTGGKGMSDFTLARAGGKDRGGGSTRSTELLAAAGGGYSTTAADTPCARQVRVWSVENERETQLRTLEFDAIADSVALRADAGQLAVGLRDGMVQVFSTATWELVVELSAHMILDDGASGATEDPRVLSLQFSPDGTKLAAGRNALEEFTVYDLSATAAVVSRFHQPKSSGFGFAFFPSGDMLVTGGGVPGKHVVRMLPQPVGQAKSQDTLMAMVPSSSGGGPALSPPDISSADMDGESGVVALAAGSCVEVRGPSGELLMSKDFGMAIGAYSNIATGVRIQPGGALVTCILAGGKVGVVVLAVADGSEVFRFDSGGANLIIVVDMAWSPDGALLALGTTDGTCVLAADQGGAEVCWLEKGKSAMTSSCCFDSTGSWLATGSSNVSIWDASTWKLAQTMMVKDTEHTTFFSVCFSPSSDCIAYNSGSKEVVVRSLDDGSGEELHRFKNVNARSGLSFSPDGKLLLCCPDASVPLDPHTARVLDLATGTGTEWAQLLPGMALPVAGGLLAGNTLGWGQVSRGDGLTQPNDDLAGQSWVLYGAVGSQFVVADVAATHCAIEDNACTTERLVFISEQYPELVVALAQSAPHLVNIRDSETGDTVLHHLARTRQTEQLHVWFDSGATVTPIKNAEGQTAVMVAISMEQTDVAQLLWRALPCPVNLFAAALVLEELRMLPMSHPYLVKSFLEDVEPAIMQTVTTFRTSLVRPAEVCGLPTISLANTETAEGSGDAAATPGSEEDSANIVPAAWAGKLPTDQPKTLVASKVVLLPNILGDAKNSPFHAIVTHCDASVFESKLLELIIQSKWEENIRFPRQLSIMLYGCALAVGSAAMLASAARDSSSSEGEAATFVDVLQGLMICFEVVALGSEGWQLVRASLRTASQPRPVVRDFE